MRRRGWRVAVGFAGSQERLRNDSLDANESPWFGWHGLTVLHIRSELLPARLVGLRVSRYLPTMAPRSAPQGPDLIVGSRSYSLPESWMSSSRQGRLSLAPPAIGRGSRTSMGCVHERSLKRLPNLRDGSRASVPFFVTATTTVQGLTGRWCSDRGRVISPTSSLSNDFRQYTFLDMRRGNWQSRNVKEDLASTG